MRRFRKILAVSLAFAFAVLCGQTYTLDPVSRKIFNAPELPIFVSSENADVLAVARRAFEIHGGFKLATEKDAAYRAHFVPVAGGVQVSLTGGSAPLTTVASAPTTRRATLRACDAVVSHVLHTPGFFDTKLAFVSDVSGTRELYSSDLLFGGVKRLTGDGANSIYPRWSPDGKRLMYTGYFRSGFPDIFMLDFSTNKRATVAAFKGTNTGACWSPDGRRTAMALSSSGNPEIYVGDTFGKNLKRLTRTKALEATPSFSPDGSQLVFVSDQLGGPQLYTISADGGAMSRLTRGISNHCTEPAWNPRNADLIAFTAAFGRGFQIALHNRANGSNESLTAGPGSGTEAAWLNDGRHLVYTQRQGKASKLRIFDTLSGRSYDLHSARIGNTSQASAVYEGAR